MADEKTSAKTEAPKKESVGSAPHIITTPAPDVPVEAAPVDLPQSTLDEMAAGAAALGRKSPKAG